MKTHSRRKKQASAPGMHKASTAFTSVCLLTKSLGCFSLKSADSSKGKVSGLNRWQQIPSGLCGSGFGKEKQSWAKNPTGKLQSQTSNKSSRTDMSTFFRSKKIEDAKRVVRIEVLFVYFIRIVFYGYNFTTI